MLQVKNQKISRIAVVFLLIPCSIYLVTLSGCVTVPSAVSPVRPEGIPGFYHRVEKGQTLWSISQMYNIDLDEVARINHVQDTATIEIGQLIFIPRASRQPQVVPRNIPGEGFIWPVKGRVIATFGSMYKSMLNKGLNIQAAFGSNVIASRSGRVVFYNSDFGNFGKTVIVDHEDGFITVYARNSQVLVKVGDIVQRGSPIARVGAGSGKDRDSYLHFEIRKSALPQNPYYYLPR